jgi:hypothetical protein
MASFVDIAVRKRMEKALLLSNSLKSSGDWRGKDASSTLWIRSNPLEWKIFKERSKER